MRMAWIMLLSVTQAGSGGRGWDWLEEWLRARLEREQVALGGETFATRVATKRRPLGRAPGRKHDPMAGNDDRDRIAAVCLADGAGAASGHTRNVDIRPGLAVGDGDQRLPDLAPVRCTGGTERQVEFPQLAIEVSMELVARTSQQRGLALIAAPTPVDGDDVACFFGDREVTDRRMQ